MSYEKFTHVTGEEIELFHSRVKKDPSTPDQCWEWQGPLNNGYGYLYIKRVGHVVLSHRLSYLAFKGPLLKKMVIDHMCCNRNCVNPDHLRQVTYQVNLTENTKKGPLNKVSRYDENGRMIKQSKGVQ